MAKSTVVGVLSALLGAAFLARGGPALAGLGQTYSSVDTDRLVLGARIASTAAGPYTVHTLTLANQGVVKELTRSDGTVFAVLWRAPGRPDLRLLMGDRFNAMQADSVRTGRRVRRPISVNRTDLVVQSGGHPGAFWGAAVIPQLQPAGFSASDLK